MVDLLQRKIQSFYKSKNILITGASGYIAWNIINRLSEIYCSIRCLTRESNKGLLSINTKYIEGPLKNLNTEWVFKKINNKKTKVLFNVKFKFQKFFHQKIAEIFYELIENTMIDSFKKRADEILD